MDLVKSLALALDSGNEQVAEILFDRLLSNYLKTLHKPIVPPFRYWIIVAKMPKAAKILILGGESEEKDSFFLASL